MNVVDLNRPAVFGFPLTLWLIIFFLSIIGIIVSLIMIIISLGKKETVLENIAAASAYKMPVKDVEVYPPVNDDTQADFENNSVVFTDRTVDDISGDVCESNDKALHTGRVGFRGDLAFKSGIAEKPEQRSLLRNSQTQGQNKMTVSLGLLNIEKEAKNAKFCERCGNRITGQGRFCSRCGSKII